jgi:hypothetical protein
MMLPQVRMPFSQEDYSEQGIFQMRFNIITADGEVIQEGQVREK